MNNGGDGNAEEELRKRWWLCYQVPGNKCNSHTHTLYSFWMLTSVPSIIGISIIHFDAYVGLAWYLSISVARSLSLSLSVSHTLSRSLSFLSSSCHSLLFWICNHICVACTSYTVVTKFSSSRILIKNYAFFFFLSLVISNEKRISTRQNVLEIGWLWQKREEKTNCSNCFNLIE